VSCPELDFLATEARTLQAVAGARMMGGGFGGCNINIVQADAVDSFSQHMQKSFASKFSKTPEVYVTQVEDGVKII
jgi:galactokinase